MTSTPTSARPTAQGGPLGQFVVARGVLTFGASATAAALPLIAVAVLEASPVEVGVIVAIGMLVNLLLAVPISTWSDRRRDQIALLAWCSLASAGAALVVPVLWWGGGLTLVTLYAAVTLSAVLVAARGSLGHAVVNDLAPPDRRVAAVGRLQAVLNTAEIGGQSAGGGLVAVVAAPLVPLVDAVASAISALLFRRIGSRSPDAARRIGDASPSEVHELRGPEPPERARPVVRALLASLEFWAVLGVATLGGLIEPIFVIYAVRELGVPVAAMGLVFASGAVGAISAGLAVDRLQRRWGARPTAVLGVAVAGLASLPMILVSPSPYAVAAALVFEFGTALGGTILIASVFGSLQERTPRAHIGRTMSSAQVTMQVAALAGLGLGMAATLVVGQRETFAMYGAAVAALLLVMLVRMCVSARADRTPA